MEEKQPMRALLTNDDGIDSEGLLVLAQVALDVGLELTVAAPDADRSGASASLSAVAADGRLLMKPRPLPQVAGVRALAVDATPAMIAFVAARGAFGPVPDIVLSGANHGPNVGHATLHSGTVGAALTAASYGLRAFALSVDAAAPRHWTTVRELAGRALRWWLVHGDTGVALSVNVPDRQDVHGLRHASLAPFGAVQALIGEAGEEYVTVSFSEEDRQAAPGTDAALLGEGWATATALCAPCESTAIDVSAISEK
jgi:5'-nucleotidase